MICLCQKLNTPVPMSRVHMISTAWSCCTEKSERVPFIKTAVKRLWSVSQIFRSSALLIKACLNPKKWDDSTIARVLFEIRMSNPATWSPLSANPWFRTESISCTFLVKNVRIQVKRRLSRDYESFGNTTRAQSEHLRFTAGTRRGDK